MKIKTEILQTVYIITCEGPSLNPSPVGVFLSAMKILIQKNHLDILLDLSGIEVVEGAKLGTIARSLEAIEGYGLLIFCGVTERDLNVLKMTSLDKNFLQATNRNHALSTLFWERKNAPAPVIPPPPEPEPPVVKKEPEVLPEKEKTEPLPREVAPKETEEEEQESIYDIEFDVIEVDVSDDIEEDEQEVPRASVTTERRRFKRAKSRSIMDEEFMVFCQNTVTGKHYTAVVFNISQGGLLVKLVPPRITVGEELSFAGRLGRNFKFNERAVCHSQRQEKFVFEFIELSDETTRFLNRLTASLK